MQQLLESGWTGGWTPSDRDRDAGQHELSLLRMDNLTLDEKGSLRIAKSARAESVATFSPLHSIYGISMDYNSSGATSKLRYAYDGASLVRNYGASALQSTFDKSIFTGATARRCTFLNALGHVLAVAGTKKYKDRGDVQFPLGIPKPATPTVVANAAVTLALDNKSGGNYTNWSSVESSALTNAGAYLSAATAVATNRGIVQTAFSLDATNLGGTGNQTDDDIFTFNFNSDDPTSLVSLRVEFLLETPTGSTTVPDTKDYYWFQWDFQTITGYDIEASRAKLTAVLTDRNNPNNSSLPLVTTGKSTGQYDWILQLGANVWTAVTISRSQFNRVGSDATKDWSAVKAVRVTFTGLRTITVRFNDLIFKGGKTSPLTGDFKYVAVEVRDTGNYLEFSPASEPTAALSVASQSIKVTPAAAADSQVNQYWIFRTSDKVGTWTFVHSATGALGFTAAAYDDINTDIDILTAAATNPQYTLEYYRTALPTNIIGMIWFQDRVIYLTDNSFIPSFKLDPGSYDSRFTYELAGSSTSEKCLFITKLDVGTFLVATTKDFYRVTGSFSKIDDGNGITLLDVNIRALGISDPAISYAHQEVDGAILYLSGTGLRLLVNSTATPINGTLDLLFRGEARHGIPAISLLPADESTIAVASSGKRLYWSLPHTDGVNRIYVLTTELPNKADEYGYKTWRLLSGNAACLAREEDGTVLMGGVLTDYLRSLETQSESQNIYFMNRYNYDGSPNNRKDALGISFYVNTGGTAVNVIIAGLLINGTVQTYGTTLSTAILSEVNFDIASSLVPAIAFQVIIYGNTSQFQLDHFVLNYEKRPSPTSRVILYGTNFGKPNKKKIAALPFMVDPLGAAITIKVKRDGNLQQSQFTNFNYVGTGYWRNKQDIAGTDWEMELVSAAEMEFYKFLPPEILQIFPMGKYIDQLGPLDFGIKGLVYGLRLRLICEGNLITYKVYGGDVLEFSEDFTVTPNLDDAYIIKFPKGINPAVCRVVITSDSLFYRFSGEFKVRPTGRETEETYIKVKDSNVG